MSNGPLQANDYDIPLSEAATMTARWRDSNPGENKGGAFAKKEIKDILDQAGCEGIRYYFGRDDHGALFVILVGIDANGDDMTGGEIKERAWPCPPICGDANSLNGIAT
jgi:hypothetical protein